MSAAYPLDDLPRPHRLSRLQYEQMVAANVLREGDRVELLFGVIVEMSPQGSFHVWAVTSLSHLLISKLGGRAVVRVQAPLAAGDWSEPEPDIAVTSLEEHVATAHPRSAHLVVEVALSSLEADLGPKARLYAELGVPQYWVVDLRAGVVHVHTGASPAGYAVISVVGRVGTLRVDDFPDVTVPVDAILPPA